MSIVGTSSIPRCQQQTSHIHMTAHLIWTPTVAFDPQWPLTSGRELWPPPDTGCQASVARRSGRNNRTISWCADVLSSCDHTHSPSVVPVSSNKHCALSCLLLIATSYGASRAAVFCTNTTQHPAADIKQLRRSRLVLMMPQSERLVLNIGALISWHFYILGSRAYLNIGGGGGLKKISRVNPTSPK